MEKAKVVHIVAPLVTVADHGILVQVVVARGKYEANDDDHKRPLLMKGEDEVANLDLTGIEQLLHMAGEAFSKIKQYHVVVMLLSKDLLSSVIFKSLSSMSVHGQNRATTASDVCGPLCI